MYAMALKQPRGYYGKFSFSTAMRRYISQTTTLPSSGSVSSEHARFQSSFNKSRYITEHDVEDEESAVTLRSIQNRFLAKDPIIAVSAYDYPSALACEKAGVDVIVVDESEFMHVLGHKSSMMLTLDEILHHSRAIARAAPRPFVVCDFPFGVSQFSADKVLESAVRLVKDGRVQGIKVRNSPNGTSVVKLLCGTGIPVMGHMIHPSHRQDTWRMDLDTDSSSANSKQIATALEMQKAGCFGIVLDHFPPALAQSITQALNVPTISIASGKGTSGQLIHYTDLMGMVDRPYAESDTSYVDMKSEIDTAIQEYHSTVRSCEFPDLKKHCYAMPKAQLAEFRESTKGDE